MTAGPPESQQNEGSPGDSSKGRRCCWPPCGSRVARRTLTYGPQDGVEGARVLFARGEVLPGNLELAIWEPPHS